MSKKSNKTEEVILPADEYVMPKEHKEPFAEEIYMPAHEYIQEYEYEQDGISEDILEHEEKEHRRMLMKMVYAIAAFILIVNMTMIINRTTTDKINESYNVEAGDKADYAFTNETGYSAESDKESDDLFSDESDDKDIINLSEKSYGYAKQVSEKYYVVAEDNNYGLVDFEGNVIVPVEYDAFALAGFDEIVFYRKNNAYVYNAITGKMVFEYAVKESFSPNENDIVETIVSDDGETHILKYQGSIHRAYGNGILIEIKYLDGYSNYIEAEVTFTNVSSKEVIFSGYAGTDWYIPTGGGITEYFNYGTEGILIGNLVSMYSNDDSAVMFEYSIKEQKSYIVIVNKNGYTKKEITDIDRQTYWSGRGKVVYNNGWLKLQDKEVMINVNTMEEFPMVYHDSGYIYAPYSEQFSAGKGEYYGKFQEGGDGYDICKGNTILVKGCLDMTFYDDYIVYQKESGLYQFMTYDGSEIMEVKGYGDFINGKAYVYDGEGVYCIDKSFHKIGDYIYKGEVEDCRTGAVYITGENGVEGWYLLKDIENK